MTYKEKYCEDHDVEIEESFYLRSCPCNYNYESLPDDYSKGDCIHPDMECDKCWNREMVTSNPKSKEKLIKSDFPGLKVNDIVLFRDKTLAIVLPNHYSKNGISTFKITKNTSLACITHCSSYKENRSWAKDYDIVKIWRPNDHNANNILADFFLKRMVPSKDPFWIETPPKKMTKEEIEEELGYSIEIVENHDEDEEE